MKSNNILKGVAIIAVGAASYGMLATFVKLAYKEGYTTPEVTIAQLVIGFLLMTFYTLFKEKKQNKPILKLPKSDVLKLVILGTSLGLTTLFYYLAVKYVSVSTAIVLLMQTTWISVVLECIIQKTFPSMQKIIAVVLVLVGTVLTTNILGTEIQIDARGIIFGFLSAISFTTTMFASNKIATYLPAYKKSSIMLLGGFLAITIYNIIGYTGHFDFSIFYSWGIILAIFGTIIPPLAFNTGFPLTGLGLGSIVSATELPVSIIMAYFFLGESVIGIQIAGIVLILGAIVLMNLKFKKQLA